MDQHLTCGRYGMLWEKNTYSKDQVSNSTVSTKEIFQFLLAYIATDFAYKSQEVIRGTLHSNIYIRTNIESAGVGSSSVATSITTSVTSITSITISVSEIGHYRKQQKGKGVLFFLDY